jgi:valyl-tRNA synthetase
MPALSPADRWILSRLQEVISQATEQFHLYEYATVKSLLEVFFWNDLADNYLEMAKQRLYEKEVAGYEGARFCLYRTLLDTIKLFAPFLPHVTEQIYQGLFASEDHINSIHLSSWPAGDPGLLDPSAQEFGQTLVQIATAVRRYKSNMGISLGSELATLHLATGDKVLRSSLREALGDISSITRARSIIVASQTAPNWQTLGTIGSLRLALSIE